MFSLQKGKPIATIVGGEYNGELIHLYIPDQATEKKPCCKKCSPRCKRRPCCRGCGMCYRDDSHILGTSFDITEGKLTPLLDVTQRPVDYIAGPSGSGKSYIAAEKIRSYRKIFPEKELLIFSRTDMKNDNALKDLGGSQITINDKLIEEPIDIEKELSGGCIVLFDDCNTIQNEGIKKAVEKLMSDIMEVGRKLDIAIIMTNHLVQPNERKFGRTVLNELQTLTIFPKSGSASQITTALQKYFGLDTKKIKEILNLPSRWVQISKTYPMYAIHEGGALML